MSKSDLFTILLTFISLGAGAYMTRLRRTTIRWLGLALLIVGVGGALIWFGHYGIERAEAPAGTTISAPNNTGIVTQGQTGGTNIVNQEPPRLLLGLYQSGQQIGIVADFSPSVNGKQVLLRNPRIASGAANPNANIEFQKYVLTCSALASMINPNAAFNSSVIVGTIPCDIIGTR